MAAARKKQVRVAVISAHCLFSTKLESAIPQPISKMRFELVS